MDYQRITSFPELTGYHSSELRALASVWDEKKAALEDNGAYRQFIEKLKREWAIETGIIERLYTWDRGVTEVLIEQGIESSIIAHRSGIPRKDAEQVQVMIRDHLGIVEGLFGYVKGEEPLSEYFIRNLHAKFTEYQDYTDALTAAGDLVQTSLTKGNYKRLPNNPRRRDGSVHAYCPPEFTKEEMENLVRFYRENESDYDPEVRAAWLHHRFTTIHPFQDGNGRVARALATLVFLRAGLFPLVVRDSDREEYILALESADANDLHPLIAFFARRQRDAILKALGLEQQVQQNQYADQIINSALVLLQDRFNNEKKKTLGVYDHERKLFTIVRERISALATNLDGDLRKVSPHGRKPPYSTRHNFADNTHPDKLYYFQGNITTVAKRFGYFANFEQHRSWVRITIVTEREFDYVVSFHGYGYGDNGILAVSAFSYSKAPERGSELIDLQPATMDIFQFNYAESYHTIEGRFKEWLEGSLAIALAEWKRSL